MNPTANSLTGLTSTSRWERLVEHSPTIRTFEQDPSWATSELREKFTEFVAGTFFKTMLAAMRKTVGKDHLMHGGRAEEIFQAQLDATITQRISSSRGGGFADEMYQQFVRMQSQDNSEQAPLKADTHAEQKSNSRPLGEAADHTF